MHLLIAILASIICTIIWYRGLPNNKMNVGLLCFMYWGSSILWFTDAIYNYINQQGYYTKQSIEQMLDDSILGVSAVAFGLVIWIVRLLYTDPEYKIRYFLQSNSNNKM
jgi:hypothetical protein